MRMRDLQELVDKIQQEGSGLPSPLSSRIIGAPLPFPDEAFTSWIDRLSLKYKTAKTHLLARFNISVPSFWIDAGVRELNLRRIAYMTGIAPERLAAFNEAAFTLMSFRKFAYMTTDLARRQPVFRYCAKCLQEDNEPYGRRLWRLSFVHLCPKHRTILRDSCPHCRTPIREGYGIGTRRSSLGVCHACNGNLSATTSIKLADRQTSDLLNRQIRWVEFASALGSFQQGSEFWYGDLNPQDILYEFGLLRGRMDYKFNDSLYRYLGLWYFRDGRRLVFRRGALEGLFEFKGVKLVFPSSGAHDLFLGGEYVDMRDGISIADIVGKCHQLTMGDSLWRELRGGGRAKVIACISSETWCKANSWVPASTRGGYCELKLRCRV